MFSLNNNAKEFILRSISNSINDRSDISILDFACGTCKIWDIFFKKHSSVNFYGFDFNSKSIAKARNFFPQFNDHIMNLDGQGKLPFDRKFDIITTFSSLEHVYDKKSFINNISNFSFVIIINTFSVFLTKNICFIF